MQHLIDGKSQKYNGKDKMKYNKQYAICDCCKQTKAPLVGCRIKFIQYKKQNHPRIKVGDAISFDPDADEDYLCPGCNAGRGQYHHYGCDMERCPRCGKQLYGCACNYKIPVCKYHWTIVSWIKNIGR